MTKKYLKTIQIVLLSTLLLFGYQNCADQVQFTHENLSSTIELTPSSKTSLQTVKILFLIDPSPSMVDDLGKMNNALNVFLDSLKTLPVEIRLESVIQSAASNIKIEYVDSASNKSIKVDSISIHPDELASTRNYKTEAIKKAINDHVQYAFKNRQAQDEPEQPVCKAMFNLLSPHAKFFVANENQKDSGAIILISDEDETIQHEGSYCTLDSTTSIDRYIPAVKVVQQSGEVALKSPLIQYTYDKYDEGGNFIKTDLSSWSAFDKLSFSNPLFCSESLMQTVQNELSQNENKFYRNYKVTQCLNSYTKKSFAFSGDVKLTNILKIDEVQKYALDGKLDPYLKNKRDFHNQDYYDSFLLPTPPNGISKETWEASDYCTRKSNYPLANKALNPMTINEFLDYLDPNGTTTFVYTYERKCYYEKQERTDGGYNQTSSAPIYAREYLANYLNLPSERQIHSDNKYTVNELAQKAIDQRFGLNQLVIYGIFNTQAVVSSDNGKKGTIIQDFLRLVSGETANINQNTYNASFNRIKDLIFERIVGKSLSVPYDLKHEYVKSVTVKNSKGDLLVLQENTDFKIQGNVLIFLKYDPKYDDKFLVVIESAPLI